MTKTKRKKINCIIRADGDINIGHGHLKRCLVLSVLLKNHCNIHFVTNSIPKYIKRELKTIGVNVRMIPKMASRLESEYIINKIDNFNLIIIDGYNFKYNYQKFFYKKNKKIIIIDDLIKRKFLSHLIINHAPFVSRHRYKNSNKAELCLGLKYKIVSKCFYPNRIIDRSKIKNNIFICLGSGQKNLEATIKIVRFLLKSENINKIFLLSPFKKTINNKFKGLEGFQKLVVKENLSSEKIYELMQQSRFGICSSSTIAIESFTATLPLIIGYSANNQLNIYRGLIRSKVALGIGSFKLLKKNKLISSIKMLENKKYLTEHFYSQKERHNLSSRSILIEKILYK
tara:strand:- start:21 stop:1049 length:1029 start_codon:yes stop_codon:yes gene_type:complete